MTFPESDQPVITSPEDLLAAGEMPQVPYEKLARAPEGWEAFFADAVIYVNDALELDTPITDRHLTLHQGKVSYDTTDPDQPQVVENRLGLLSVADGEGGDPAWWLWLDRDEDGGALVAFPPVKSETEARESYARVAELPR